MKRPLEVSVRRYRRRDPQVAASISSPARRGVMSASHDDVVRLMFCVCSFGLSHRMPGGTGVPSERELPAAVGNARRVEAVRN
jgi:hypothetical protein